MARIIAGKMNCPHLQEESRFCSQYLQRCSLDGTTVEGGRTLGAPTARNAHRSHSCLWSKSVRQNERARCARDALPFLVMSWILAFNRRKKVAVCCSDVSGAVDRVRAERLLEKLRYKGVHSVLVSLAGSWLQQRTAQVVVEGQRSNKMRLRNMVFQGTVLRHTLEPVLRGCPARYPRGGVRGIRPQCQRRLRHDRGQEVLNRAAQVFQSEPGIVRSSEGIRAHSVTRTTTRRPIQTARYHIRLQAQDGPVRAGDVNQASWKLTTILRTRRFHEVTRLVQVHKSKIPSFVEYRTPAVYHAASTILPGIDAVQRRFLRVCCLTEEDALMFFNLAPLETRRDMAMLVLIHRTVLGCDTRHFASIFRLAPPSSSQKHCWQLQSYSSETGPLHTGSHRRLQSASSKGC